MNINKIVYFDTETVAIQPNYIISLAYRYYEKGKDPVIGMIECNPDYPINPKASEVNGYTDENVKKFPLFVEQWKKLEPYFRDAIWVGHNVKFDVRALRGEFNRYDLPEPHHYEIDTLAMARTILNNGETPNHKLITLCQYYGIEGEDYHSADFDIWATDKLYRKFAQVNKESDGKYNELFKPIEVEGEYTKSKPPCKICHPCGLY